MKLKDKHETHGLPLFLPGLFVQGISKRKYFIYNKIIVLRLLKFGILKSKMFLKYHLSLMQLETTTIVKITLKLLFL